MKYDFAFTTSPEALAEMADSIKVNDTLVSYCNCNAKDEFTVLGKQIIRNNVNDVVGYKLTLNILTCTNTKCTHESNVASVLVLVRNTYSGR